MNGTNSKSSEKKGKRDPYKSLYSNLSEVENFSEEDNDNLEKGMYWKWWIICLTTKVWSTKN